MKKQLIHYFSLLSFLLLLGSCVSSEKILYFQDKHEEALNASMNYLETKIQVGDLISINVSALNGEAAVPFNLYDVPQTDNSNTQIKPIPYLVDTDGQINFPVIGKIKISGLTTKELTTKLESLLVDYISDPVINIRFENFRVSILGEVNSPGTYPVTNEQMSIIEAISLAGDLTIYGVRQNILLIRIENGEKKQIRLDITDNKILDSPYFYLKQNDIIYVTPNKHVVNSSAIGQDIRLLFSTISLLMSITTFILVL